MIDGRDNYQLELFREARGRMPNMPLRNRFFNFLHRHEKKVLIVIGIALSCIVAFSWGVKKGREFSSTKTEASFDLAGKKAEAKEISRPPQEKQARREKAGPDKQGYTIQLASYKAKKFADTQAEVLKKKGLAPLVLRKGDYIILCVGRFSDKDEARSSLSKFKKDYKDCYLRRL